MTSPQHQLFISNPSRYVVYQMIDYVFQGRDEKLIQKEFQNMHLVKIEPFQDEKYNCVYFFQPEITEDDLVHIQEFFQGAAHRIKFPCSEALSHFLDAHGYVVKCRLDVMVKKDLSQDIFSILPDALTLLPVDNAARIQQYVEVLSKAYGRSLALMQQKFWFYDTVLMDPEDTHINTFLLYEHEKPVATGSYYAFDTFSIENIGTIPESRWKGYAQIIMKKLLQEAKNLWYSQAVLVAEQAGVPTYKKLGFTTLHETMQAVLAKK